MIEGTFGALCDDDAAVRAHSVQLVSRATQLAHFGGPNYIVGAFVTWRTHMRRVLADCRVSGVVHARALRNCARESLQ